MIIIEDNCENNNCECKKFDKYLEFNPEDEYYRFDELLEKYPEAYEELDKFLNGTGKYKDHFSLYNLRGCLYHFIIDRARQSKG